MLWVDVKNLLFCELRAHGTDMSEGKVENELIFWKCKIYRTRSSKSHNRKIVDFTFFVLINKNLSFFKIT